MTPQLETERLILRPVQVEDAARFVALYSDNREHFGSALAVPPEAMNTVDLWTTLLSGHRAAVERGEEIRLLAFARDAPDGPIVGMTGFTRIRRAMDMSCTLSFAIDHRHVRRGLTSEMVEAGIGYVFDELGLHRIDAEFKVSNTGSRRALARLGFTEIGVAPRYRYSDGEWRDHVLTMRLSPHPMEPAGYW